MIMTTAKATAVTASKAAAAKGGQIDSFGPRGESSTRQRAN